MEREVVFAPEARDDLLELYNYIAGQAGAARARAYTGRIVSDCLASQCFPSAGDAATICVLGSVSSALDGE